jgi:hypothetical protein
MTLNPRVFKLTKGWHKLVFRGKDVQAGLDGIVFTNDPNLVPTDASFTRLP